MSLSAHDRRTGLSAAVHESEIGTDRPSTAAALIASGILRTADEDWRLPEVPVEGMQVVDETSSIRIAETGSAKFTS